MPDTLHDRLTEAFTGALTEMFRPEVGHSCTGDLPAIKDDARALARVAEKVMGDVWEQGRKHGLRQAWKPHDARVKQLEEEIENMLTIEEGNTRAFLNRCEQVRQLEDALSRATRFDVEGWDVYPHGDSWTIARHGHTEDLPDQEAALTRAKELSTGSSS